MDAQRFLGDDVDQLTSAEGEHMGETPPAVSFAKAAARFALTKPPQSAD
jgi:hypothetical protein